MSFDKDTRNLLARTVAACRRRLVEDVTDQLRGVFGLHPDGVVLPLEKLTHLSPDQHAAARRLRDLLDHYTAGAAGKDSDRSKAAHERMVLEISFTALNRLAALRLCEERGLVVECVRKGTTSAGFQMFERISGGALGGRYDTYRVFLECLFDELALDLGILFDRMTPQSAVFPSERCMEDVLAELNKTELTHLWTEDETIGWVYQYFNPPEERKAMREASQAPRNSRELAVRNQFFTPRYVVEFLTDNTLGRIWYEMRKGDTELREECRYLVRRPNEVFLGPGEKAPVGRDDETDLSQEELLKRPVYIEHRPKKDPRDLRILDPACGSGHFLLYAFDLLERIYEEGWVDPESPASEITGRPLREEFQTLDDLRREGPKLIVEHNLHGIDIDPRAVQIAASALWLRAQKTWKNLGLKTPERPRIARSNIVIAEPMPGEEDMRREFTAGLKPRVLGQIVDEVFEKMKLAGEAGSLLKIEEEIKDAVAAAKQQWWEQPKPVQLELFGGSVSAKPAQMELRFDVKGITDERFWEQAEDRILEALKEYAERAENGHATRRRLFAEDAARGFAFIDLSRKRYDVVLMNPPFGEPTGVSTSYINKAFPSAFIDVLAAFVERAFCLCEFGRIGALTSRACLYTKTLTVWREQRFLPSVDELLDLGGGVLDGAMVFACASTFSSPYSASSEACQAIDLRKSDARDSDLIQAIQETRKGMIARGVYFQCRHRLATNHSARFLYNIPDAFWEWSRASRTLVDCGGSARAGATTYDDFRFLRLAWEAPARSIGWSKNWVFFAKGGYFETFYNDIHLLVKWLDDGREVGEFNRIGYNTNAQSRRASSYYKKPGVTYPRRTIKGFSPRALPRDCIFADKGPVVFCPEEMSPGSSLGYLNALPIRAIIHLQVQAGSFETGVVNTIPWLDKKATADIISGAAANVWREKALVYRQWETDRFFAPIILSLSSSILDFSERAKGEMNRRSDKVLALSNEISESVASAYTLPEVDYEDFEVSPDDHRIQDDFGIYESQASAFYVVQFVVGCALGRWDVRIAIDPSLAPKLPDPFDPLPVCPPGMLVGPDGLPAEANRIVSEEWLRARPDADTLPPEGSVKNPTIPDSEYPLRISWDGVLVDDPGFNGDRPHRDDIVRRVREVFDLLWKDKSHEIEQEACDILGVSDLRDYFRKPAGFFQDHLKRYSKSRRKAPIYWPLSTPSGSYTIWLYYHRLNEQTLYGAVNKYVEPKISEVERGTAQIENDLKAASGREATRLTDRLGEARAFVAELRDLREELLRIAALPYKPDLNDGVIINAAPFHGLFRLRSWAKDTEDCWKKLAKGDFDWAHSAYTIWPDRVRKVCRTDRSIAIAHRLEDLCEVEAPESKKKGGRGRRKKEAAR